MKVIHILVNVLPLPIWLAYYLLTLSTKDLFMMPFDELVSFVIVIAFTIYNLFSENVLWFLIRNLIGTFFHTSACLISGQIYLKLCYHMSDEHYAVKSIPFDIAKETLIITAIACIVSFFITIKRNKLRRNKK